MTRTELSWPQSFYSMSHIAIPFRADDLVYGDGTAVGDNSQRVNFGVLAPRGEEGVLRLKAEYFLRTRYNPFFSYQANHLREWLGNL